MRKPIALAAALALAVPTALAQANDDAGSTRVTLVFEGRPVTPPVDAGRAEIIHMPPLTVSPLANAGSRTVRYMTAEEWAAFQARHMGGSTPYTTDSDFQALDADGDGAVSKAEWARRQEETGPDAPPFERYDANGDGRLTSLEYSAPVKP